MNQVSNRPRGQSHFVPCVLRTIEILDALRHERRGLRIEEMQTTSRASRSTTYRIVRSLLLGEYIVRDTWGRYHLNPGVIQFAQDAADPGLTDRNAILGSDSASGFERWGVRFRADGRRSNAAEGLTA